MKLDIQFKAYPKLKQLLRGISRRQSGWLQTATEVTLSGGAWDGGSRQSWVQIAIATGKKTMCPTPTTPPQFGGPKAPPKFEIKPGTVVVQCGTFQGKPSYPTVYVRPEDCNQIGVEYDGND